MASWSQSGRGAPPPLQSLGPPDSHEFRGNQQRANLNEMSAEASEQARQALAMKDAVLQKIGENDRQYRRQHSPEHQQSAQQHQEQHADEKHRPTHQLSDYGQQSTRHAAAQVDQTRGSAAAQARKRPSPIEEESTFVSGSPPKPASSNSSTAASSRSSQTVRGISAATNTAPKTPAYPFPRMAPQSRPNSSSTAPRSYAARSTRTQTNTSAPETNNREEPEEPASYQDGSHIGFTSGQVLPTPPTPSSVTTFLPSSEQDDAGELKGGSHDQRQRARFPVPNLYELSLALAAEPGLDAWWNTVVHIATEWYRAERIALIIPADSADVENMPWGQKATYNTHGKGDGMSLGYMGHGGNHAGSTADVGCESPSSAPSPSRPASGSVQRPKLTSRHSYTAYEERKQNRAKFDINTVDSPSVPRRPAMKRSQTSHHIPKGPSDAPQPRLSFANLDRATLEKHDATHSSKAPIPHWEDHFHSVHETRGRVLPVIQALDYEADPLIDHLGVGRVLHRGRAVALTRSYPYIDPESMTGGDQKQKQQNSNEQTIKPPLEDATNQLSSGSATKRASSASTNPKDEGAAAATTHRAPHKPLQFEEYEQIPPSPWSQSPAPSPAVRSDSTSNPFFSSAVVDEGSFNPDSSPEDYTRIETPEAIGIDNSWTVLHIPLFHPLLSKPNPVFRLDTAKMEQRSAPPQKPDANKDNLSGSTRASSKLPSPEPQGRPRQMPIAILSILSPVIPYPSHLLQSLEHLAPHMATTFSLCSHLTNLEAEVCGLHRRRHDVGGFGAIDTEGRPLPTSLSFAHTPYVPMDDAISHMSISDSMTSFSDYSGPPRSWMGSPGVTPGWDATSMNLFFDRRVNIGNGMSPSLASMTGDGYFGARPAALSLSNLWRPVTTPSGGSNSGSGGAMTVQRPRKSSSAAQAEKRIAALRQSTPEITSHAREPSIVSPHTTLSPEFPALAPAIIPTSSPAQKESVPKVDQGQEMQQEQHIATNLPEPGSASVHASEDADGSSVTNRSVSGTSGDLHVSELKLSSSGKNIVSDDAKSTTSDRIPLPGPYPLSPANQNHHRQQQQQHQQRRSRHRHSNSHGKNHSQLHSHGADFASTFPLLPPSSNISVKAASANTALPTSAPSRATSVASSNPVDMPPPSDRLKSLMLDALPTHVFVALPQTGAIVWVNSRYLAYRGQTVESLAEDPWASIHPDDRDEYLKAWSQTVRTGDQFSRTVRIRRFDGEYRWFQARAVASRDRRNSIMQFLGSYMDIHDQHIAELKAARQEEIEASEIKHRILANLIPQIIFTATEEEGVTFANEQWQRYTGQPFEKLLGLGFLDSVHPDDLANCSFLPVPQHLQKRRQRLQQSLSSSLPSGRPDSWNSSRHNSGSKEEEGPSELAELARRGIIMITTDDNGRPSYTTEIRVRSKTGEYRWHLVRCVETGTVELRKSHNSYFGSATDINDHKLLETKLKEAMDSKTRFLSNMSHEIRTPLIGISGMVSFLQDTTLNEEQRDYTNTILSSANSLLMIINDILDLSKVDAGMMKLSFEWFHTRSLIEDVNELVSTMAIAKGLELSHIVEADVPGWVKGDRVRIRQVLLNVIGNAIKFTAHGEVFSRCRVIQPAPSSDKIVLEYSVTDTGSGFTKEEAELIFKPFSQIDGSSTRQHGGSGLGLVISRQLVELHGGKMEGTAEPGKGSTFTFTAVFGLPTESDHPDRLATSFPPNLGAPSLMTAANVGALSLGSASTGSGTSLGVTSDPESLAISSPSGNSSGSLDPSITSAMAQPLSDRPPLVSSTKKADVAAFSRATQATGRGQSELNLDVSRNSDVMASPRGTSSLKTTSMAQSGTPMLSILIICPQIYSREATAQHIEMTLPKEVPHHITILASAAEARQLVGGGNPEIFTHIVINLPSPQGIIDLVDQLDRSAMLESVKIVVLSDSVQRQAVNKLAAGTRFEQLLSDSHVTYIYKPVKPSRFAVIFDPAKERDVSIDRNRSTAQRLVETQRQSYLDLEHQIGNKGYKALLVEDNPVNQKVLKKYLIKVGVEVDMACDGEECTNAVMSRPHDYYALILCDLHMPRKDGYQACQEIRQWEAAGQYPKQIPIIALSANVMSDVHDKCVAAGFNKYITKPVDFIDLSRVVSDFF